MSERRFTKYLVSHTVQYGVIPVDQDEATRDKSKDVTHWNAYIVPNHYSHALDSFEELYREARKAFNVSKKDVECRTVVKSSWCKGCPCLRFNADAIPEAVRKDAVKDHGWVEMKGHPHDMVLS